MLVSLICLLKTEGAGQGEGYVELGLNLNYIPLLIPINSPCHVILLSS